MYVAELYTVTPLDVLLLKLQLEVSIDIILEELIIEPHGVLILKQVHMFKFNFHGPQFIHQIKYVCF